MCVQNLKSVASPVPENMGYPNLTKLFFLLNCINDMSSFAIIGMAIISIFSDMLA